ncbi:MAG: hypothetical protein R3C68_01675 [Myxococcota bacterium]
MGLVFISHAVNGSDVARISDILLIGLRCENGSTRAVSLDNVDRVTLRYLTAYDAALEDSVILISYAAEVVVEDVAATGPGREMLSVFNANEVTVRRFWGRWVESTATYSSVVSIAGCVGCTLENIIARSVTANIIGIAVAQADNTADDTALLGSFASGMRNGDFLRQR